MKYYNCDRILSHNRIFNFVIGNRGCGKSYTFKRRAIKNFLDKGEQFVYVRRYEKDMLATAPTYFADMIFEFPDHQFHYKLGKFWIDGQIAGYPVAVSQFTKMKSVAFKDVTMIIFDEFISEGKDYIGGKDNPYAEPELCLNFYQTVARGYNQPIRENVKFVFIANSVSKDNPYFIYFGIDEKLKNDTKTIKTKAWVLEQVMNNDIADVIKKSQFGHLIAGTKYGSYAVDNDYYLDSDEFIEEMPENVDYIATITAEKVNYGLWMDNYRQIYYMNKKSVDTCVNKFSLDNMSHDVDRRYVGRGNDFYTRIKLAYENGLIRFDSQRSKNVLLMYLGI